jgi:hypothetical protein
MTTRSLRLPRRLALVAALTLGQVWWAPAATAKRRAARPLTVPVRILVARCGAEPASQPASGPAAPASAPLQPVRPRTWALGLVQAANEVLEPHGVTLVPTVEEFEPERCELEGRAQRDAVARHVTMDGHASVVVVRRIPDLAVADYDLQGVHWRSSGALSSRHYVLLAAKARGTVLAHELGHYFGLPHYKRGGNLMTPGPSDPVWRRRRKPRPHAPVLLAGQVQKLRAGVAAFLKAAPPARAQRR